MQPKTRCVSPPLRVRRNDAPGGDFERCKQRRGAVPLVIVVLAAQGACIRQLQTGLCPLQYVNRRLLINTENDRLGRRAM